MISGQGSSKDRVVGVPGSRIKGHAQNKLTDRETQARQPSDRVVQVPMPPALAQAIGIGRGGWVAQGSIEAVQTISVTGEDAVIGVIPDGRPIHPADLGTRTDKK